MASRGVSMLYGLGSEEQRGRLVEALVAVLQVGEVGGHTNEGKPEGHQGNLNGWRPGKLLSGSNVEIPKRPIETNREEADRDK